MYYFQDSNLTKQPDEVTLINGILVFITEAKGEKSIGACLAGVEPDNLADFTTSLFLPLKWDEVTFFYGIL